MLSVHVVDRWNRHLYEDTFEAYFRARHDIYVREKNWRPESPDGREIDQFDTDATTYFFGFEQDELIASARLLSCSHPTLVSEIYPHMCEREGVPRRPDWAEWTRMYVIPEKRTSGRRGPLSQISCAVMEYCVDEGVAWAGGIQEVYFLPMWRALGWRLKPMGMPQEVAGQLAVVGYLECNEAALASARRLLGIEHSLLVRRGESHPFVEPRIEA